MSVVANGLYQVAGLAAMPRDYFTNCLGTVPQGNTGMVTVRLANEGDYICTRGYTACTAFSIVDSNTEVVSLAHFDGNVTEAAIRTMVDDMIRLGARANRINEWSVTAVVTECNMTLASVWNVMDPRLANNIIALPLAHADKTAAGIAENVYYASECYVGNIYGFVDTYQPN
ncbi:MAG: hypothetical protein AAF558_02360 [Verrucomicrobiota bacterium]